MGNCDSARIAWRICLPLAGTGCVLVYLPGRGREDSVGYDPFQEVQVGTGSDTEIILPDCCCVESRQVFLSCQFSESGEWEDGEQ